MTEQRSGSIWVYNVNKLPLAACWGVTSCTICVPSQAAAAATADAKYQAG